jgi:hypothetical protein
LVQRAYSLFQELISYFSEATSSSFELLIFSSIFTLIIQSKSYQLILPNTSTSLSAKSYQLAYQLAYQLKAIS